MVRLLRRVVRLGLLAGLGVGIVKAVKGRKAPDPWADSWVSTGTPGATRPSPAPVAPVAPKPATPADTPAAPAEATGDDAQESDQASTEAASAEGAAAKPSTARATKQTRKGPARKSPTGKAEDPPGERMWVAAKDGVCPPSHPVKAKLSSKIFHTPESRNYSRCNADRCYPDEASAQADGLRPPQR